MINKHQEKKSVACSIDVNNAVFGEPYRDSAPFTEQKIKHDHEFGEEEMSQKESRFETAETIK